MCSNRLVICPFWGSVRSHVSQDIGRLFLERRQTSEAALRQKKKSTQDQLGEPVSFLRSLTQKCGSLNGRYTSPGQVTGNFTSYRMVPTQSVVSLLYKPWVSWECYWILWARPLVFPKGPSVGPILWGTLTGDQRSSDSRWRPCPTWRRQLTATLHKLNSTTHGSWGVIWMHDNIHCHIVRQHLIWQVLSERCIDELISASFVSFGLSSEHTMLMRPRIMASTASPTEAWMALPHQPIHSDFHSPPLCGPRSWFLLLQPPAWCLLLSQWILAHHPTSAPLSTSLTCTLQTLLSFCKLRWPWRQPPLCIAFWTVAKHM